MNSQRVLVVDDEPVIRKGCEQVLLKTGLIVDTAENGKKALNLLRENGYDLILVDLMMPEMDGIELLQEIQEIDKNLVAIVITGHATIESAVEAVKSGAYDYLPKPFTPENLRSIVKRGLERRRLLVEAEMLRQERDRNLLEIANERSRVRTIVNCMGEGMIVTNRKGQLVLINPIARNMLKMDGADLVESDISGLLNNPELEELIQSTLASMNSETGLITKQITFNEENAIIYLCTLAPIQEDSGEVLGLVVLLRDISEEKKLEKMKSEFVRMVAHELKAPLGAIEGYLDLILENSDSLESERRQSFVRKSRDKANSLQQLIRDLLEYSSIEAGNVARRMEPLDIREVLDEVIDFMKIEASRKSIEINIIFPPTIPRIRGDKSDLNRLFINLLSNAIKYNHEHGKIIAQVTVEELFLIVGIHDTGIGVNEKDQSRIFDDFYRVSNTFTRKISGTGLGLSIAKKIAESHYGYISVSSELGKGSTFSVHLPLLTSGIGAKR